MHGVSALCVHGVSALCVHGVSACVHMCYVCVIGSSAMYVLYPPHLPTQLLHYPSLHSLCCIIIVCPYKLRYIYCTTTTHNNVNVDCVQSYIIGASVPSPPLCGIVQSMVPRTWVDCIACICRMLSCVPSPFG